MNEARVTIDSCRYCPFKKHTASAHGRPGTAQGAHKLPLCIGREWLPSEVEGQAEETGWHGSGRVLPSYGRQFLGHGGTRIEWFDTNEIPDWCPNKIIK